MTKLNSSMTAQNKPDAEELERQWRYLVHNCPEIVNSMHQYPGEDGFKLALVRMYQAKDALIKRMIELDSISPRCYELGNGTRFFWHCPDHLVPVIKLV